MFMVSECGTRHERVLITLNNNPAAVRYGVDQFVRVTPFERPNMRSASASRTPEEECDLCMALLALDARALPSG